MVCVIGAVVWELTDITVEVKWHFVLMMLEDFELNVNLVMYRVMKVDWMKDIKENIGVEDLKCMENRIVTNKIVQEEMEDNKHAGQLYHSIRVVIWKWETSKKEYSKTHFQ